MKEGLKKMAAGESLSAAETSAIFRSFLETGDGAATDSEIGAYLAASACRLPSGSELAGAATVLREHMLRVDTKQLPNGAVIIDTCGTGGSGLSTFNTSTVVSFFAAAAGMYVAKHGNRSISSACGSADVLEALGVKVNLSPEQSAASLRETKFAFLFAPLFHPATKRVQGVRKELGLRTIFNFLGPLCNPAGVDRQLLGVSDVRMVPVMAEALLRLGTKHALVVCGEDGLDEVTLNGKTHVAEVHERKVKEYTVKPEDFRLTRAGLKDISGAEPAQAAELVLNLLNGKKDARTDIVLINTGAALYIGGVAESWKEGVEQARVIHSSRKPRKVLQDIVAFESTQ